MREDTYNAVAELLDRNVAQGRGDKVAFVDRHRTLTYGELQADSRRVANLLTRLGVRREQRVAMIMLDTVEFPMVFLGAMRAGAVPVPLNTLLTPEQYAYMLKDSRARALFVSAALLKTLEPILARLSDLEAVVVVGDGAASPQTVFAQALADMPAAFETAQTHPDEPAFWLYSSGSTGMPKGVTWMHQNLWAGARAVVHYVAVTEHDRLASLLPFSFDYGFNQLLCAVLTGATLIIERSPVPQQVAATLRAKEVTVLACVPPLWLQLVGAPEFRREPIATLRAMTNTGGRIPVEGVRDLRRLQPQARLFLMYGLTEAFRGTYLPPDEVDAHPDSMGRAIPGSEIFVLREDGTPCDDDEVGELVQRGATVAAGYWNDPETTARVYRPNPLRPAGAPDDERVVFSGDLVKRDAQGRLYYVGRRDRVIKTLGMRVSPDEIADVLYASGHVAEGIVGTEEDDVRGTRIIAYVVLKPESTLAALEGFCKRELPRHMQPARYEVRDELPRTTSGKFDLRAAQDVRTTQPA